MLLPDGDLEDQAAGGPDEEGPAVGEEGQGLGAVGGEAEVEVVEGGAGARVGEADEAVHGGGRDARAVGGEGHVEEGAAVPREVEDERAVAEAAALELAAGAADQ